MKNKMFSIIVITYNQAAMLEECLDMMLSQEYRPLELVISDDSSQDDTLNVADKWIQKNRGNFANIKFLTSRERTGIVSNIARGHCETEGDMIKIIAGDDFLGPRSLLKAANVFEDNKCLIFVGNTVNFICKDGSSRRNLISVSPSSTHFFHKSPESQFRLECLGNQISAPAVFLKREFFDKVFTWTNRHFSMIEDWPSWLFASLNGIHISHFPGPSVFYRNHSDSVSRSKAKENSSITYQILRSYCEDLLRVYELLIVPNISRLSASQRKSVIVSYSMYKDLFDSGLLFTSISRLSQFKYKMHDPIYWQTLPARIIKRVMRSLKRIDIKNYLEDS